MDAVSINLPMPPTTNHLRTPIRMGRNARLITSPDARAWKEKADALLLLQPAPSSWDKGAPMHVSIYLWYPTRAGDIDNRTKAILDALEGHVYRNDRQIRQLVIEKGVDKTNPHVDVIVRRLDR